MNTRLVAVRAECNHCASCKTPENIIQIETTRIGAGLDLDAQYFDATILEVVLGIRPGHMFLVLWHTILLPLMGFLAGATLGMILIEHDLASVILSGVGLVTGIMATRPLNPGVVYIEPVLDNKHPEIIPK